MNGLRSPLLRDFGVIKLASNPFSEGTKVIIAAGAFGYGTWAGPILMRTRKFLDHPVVRKGGDFECLFGVDIIGGTPVNPTIEVLCPRRGGHH